jgi:BirA family biotin operon repressor/biotin-[acetyl-CoA-carboxylase] ligase
MLDDQLLELLADGNFHSGESLGAILGVSRTAVWKQLKRIEDKGLVIESHKGLGYRIVGGIEHLSYEAIAGLSDKKPHHDKLHIYKELPSTNSYLKEIGEKQSIHGVFCFAERQLSGRGRRGRQWVSPYARNLYFSCGLETEAGAASLEGLSLGVGVCIWRAIHSLTNAGNIALKWPNDLIMDGGKLGGVLVEIQGDFSGACQAIIGVGLNHNMPERQSRLIDQPWADLAEIAEFTRNRLAAALIDEMSALIESYPQQGFAGFKREWEALDLTRDQKVRLITPSGQIEGIARGINDSGAILLEVDGEVSAFHGGEISLRYQQ